MKRSIACLALAAFAACADQPETVAQAPTAVAQPTSSPDCPARTEVLYTPAPPQPGFVPRPPAGAALQPPQRLTAARPDYPAASQRCREQGRVSITFCVSPEGRSENVQVVVSSGFARLDNAVLAWAARDRHTPGIVNGRPRLYCGLTMEQVFELDLLRDSSSAR